MTLGQVCKARKRHGDGKILCKEWVAAGVWTLAAGLEGGLPGRQDVANAIMQCTPNRERMGRSV